MADVTYIQANIGRNVGTDPMSDANWEWFQSSVADAICSAVRVLNDVPRAEIAQIIATHTGMGRWGALDPEESAHISLLSPWAVDVDYLREQLAIQARMFDQDAIALIVGSELVAANPWDRVVSVGSDMPKTYA